MVLFHKIPIALTLIRVALGPVVLAFAFYAPIKTVFAICLIMAFLSDIFDGIIARRLKIATERIRRLDSIADSIFYICACIAVLKLYPSVIKDQAIALGILFFLELFRYVFDYMKYRRETSYHMWSSKLWGIFLFLGFLSLLGFGQSGILVTLAIYVGMVADIEGLFISIILKNWQHDVPTFVHALKIQRAKS